LIKEGLERVALMPSHHQSHSSLVGQQGTASKKEAGVEPTTPKRTKQERKEGQGDTVGGGGGEESDLDVSSSESITSPDYSVSPRMSFLAQESFTEPLRTMVETLGLLGPNVSKLAWRVEGQVCISAYYYDAQWLPCTYNQNEQHEE
jgi:hypothetical protein